MFTRPQIWGVRDLDGRRIGERIKIKPKNNVVTSDARYLIIDTAVMKRVFPY